MVQLLTRPSSGSSGHFWPKYKSAVVVLQRHYTVPYWDRVISSILQRFASIFFVFFFFFFLIFHSSCIYNEFLWQNEIVAILILLFKNLLERGQGQITYFTTGTFFIVFALIVEAGSRNALQNTVVLSLFVYSTRKINIFLALSCYGKPEKEEEGKKICSKILSLLTRKRINKIYCPWPSN